MSAVDYVAFFIPLIFIAVLVRSWVHFVQHPIALIGLVLLTIVSILHFDVGMLATDPYDAFLDDWLDRFGFATKEIPLIAPFDADGSFLMHKLEGDQACLGLECRLKECGSAMPPGGPITSAAARASFRAWIDAGAAND